MALALLSCTLVQRNHLYSSVPSEKWFRDLCSRHSVPCRVTNHEGEAVVSLSPEGLPATSHIVILEPGQLCGGALTPWSEEEKFLWHWLGFHDDSYTLKMKVVFELEHPMPLTMPQRHRQAVFMQQASVLTHLHAIRARVANSGCAGDFTDFNHSTYDLLCRFVTSEVVQQFGAAAPTLVLPDFLHGLVLKGCWHHMMMQGSSVAVKGFQDLRRAGALAHLANVMNFRQLLGCCQRAALVLQDR